MNHRSKALSFSKVDKRLLGTWRLDVKKTMAEWTWSKRVTSQKKKRFGELLGETEVTYTRTKVIFAKKETGWHSERRYMVVASDVTSVAIVQFGEMRIKNRRKYDPANLVFAESLFPTKPKIEHIHFNEDRIFICFGKNREFFKKSASKGLKN